ncbi:hypothetical protein OEZ60_07605 [Defluviimonas sp. WL0024]|uniref:Uncharacterized protein n=1 Tax=Albidovulum salinarum TaxID=2984153 RepID=A0ABT2X7W7_9RHOB|nr:hypothetical protein [Defluviimonas sp. WL0024]MCU9847870.1 hypothetical protein [Defluviimonas sp. WL0024]
MRILFETDDRLIIEDKPLFLGLVLVLFTLSCVGWTVNEVLAGAYLRAALAFAVSLGLTAIAALAVERVWLVLDRAAGRIEFRRRNAQGFSTESFPLADLAPDGVLVQSHDDTHRLALRLASRDKPVPMTWYYQSGNHIRRCAETTSRWLRD